MAKKIRLSAMFNMSLEKADAEHRYALSNEGLEWQRDKGRSSLYDCGLREKEDYYIYTVHLSKLTCFYHIFL